jgi:hypothetical protein
LIDLDNCPHEVLDLTETAQRYDLIVASHGQQEPRVPLGMAAILGQLVAKGQIEIWPMPSGKNSADFGLTFVAGRLSAEMPSNTFFEIASKDKDLDHAVSLLRRSGFEASRIDASSLPVVTLSASSAVSTMASRLASSLSGRGAKSRPKKRRSLHAAVKARGITPGDGMAALKELEQAGAITYQANGVPQYDDAILNQIAALAPKKKHKTEPLPVKKLAKLLPPKRSVDESQMDLFEWDEKSADVIEYDNSDVPF